MGVFLVTLSACNNCAIYQKYQGWLLILYVSRAVDKKDQKTQMTKDRFSPRILDPDEFNPGSCHPYALPFPLPGTRAAASFGHGESLLIMIDFVEITLDQARLRPTRRLSTRDWSEAIQA
jgi:hypothetical protein